MNRRESHMTMGLGIPTLLVIFVVLGMTILSMLAYLKGESNARIVEREIEYAKGYYLADAQARDRLDSDGKKDNLEFIIKVSEKQNLYVSASEGNITEYRLMSEEN